jgi:dTDP-4-amino-4,6-dideoxygalactose transaminase
VLTAISRYGPRVIPNTMQIISELEQRHQLVEGPHIEAFESAFAARLGDVRAVTTSYGRMAFYYILKALDLPAGGEVVFPALTFWVMPEMARVAGLTPVFADVDPVTFNTTAAAIERVLTPRTVAIVPTHLWGLPCDMDEISALATRRQLPVVEDCAHALGARYRGRPVGTLGDAAIFSFQTLKPLNAYGGGMAVTRDPTLGARIAELAAAAPPPSLKRVRERLWHGRVLRIATRPSIFTWTLFPLLYAGRRLHWSIDMYFWERIRPLEPLPDDYRERFSNVQAAIGLEGLSTLPDWNAERQRHAQRMSDSLRGIPGVRPPSVPPDRTHVFYQYCAYVPARDALVDACLRRGVDIETLHVDLCAELGLFGVPRTVAPGAKETVRTVQIPIHESLTDEQLDRVAAVIREAATSLPAEKFRVAHSS